MPGALPIAIASIMNLKSRIRLRVATPTSWSARPLGIADRRRTVAGLREQAGVGDRGTVHDAALNNAQDIVGT
ncbi:hypothetical protein [Allorhizocola rhizosphaerae]|uniref:hypothetical protein n=1 Tax=Allorhizocola rhizosphaerae TaxID=1872709 RepID=UPI0013C302EE|nr:hypothetical protein [Allorhizocola rhizosphaerae]